MGKRIDLTGQRFGRWMVISYNEEVSKQKKSAHWNCKCDCGNERVIWGSHLRKGSSKSCGCYNKEDLIGQKFGKLTVISLNEEASKQDGGRSHWNCKCDCGNEKVVSGINLRRGSTTSCGCYSKELTSKRLKEQWKNKELRQAQSDKMKEQWQDEEMKWKMGYKGGITPIRKYLRSLPVVNQWRKDTYIRENNICQLTGRKVHGGNSDVHHLKAFSTIVLEAHKLYNIQVKSQVKDYTKEELHKLEGYVTNWHKDTSNAVLLSKEVHDLFHNLYGRGSNTPEQFEEFRERYMAGEFKNVL